MLCCACLQAESWMPQQGGNDDNDAVVYAKALYSQLFHLITALCIEASPHTASCPAFQQLILFA